MTVGGLVTRVRSKNAGPFRVTIDLFCRSDEEFHELERRLETARVARALGVAAAQLTRYALPGIRVLKFSLPRPVVQGSVGDRDQHGAQFAHVVAAIELDRGAAA